MKYLYFKMELNKCNKAEELKNKQKKVPSISNLSLILNSSYISSLAGKELNTEK